MACVPTAGERSIGGTGCVLKSQQGSEGNPLSFLRLERVGAQLLWKNCVKVGFRTGLVEVGGAGHTVD